MLVCFLRNKICLIGASRKSRTTHTNSSYYLGRNRSPPAILQNLRGVQNNRGNVNLFKWTAVYSHLN